MAFTLAPDTPIVVGIDARYDLRQSQGDLAETDSLTAAWGAALDEIAIQMGLTNVSWFTTAYGSESAQRVTHHDINADGDTIEQLLWQSAHDAIGRDDDGTWRVVGPTQDELRALRRFVGRGRR